MNIDLNKIAIGTVQFGIKYGISNCSQEKVPYSEVKKIISFAQSNYINTFDTAAAYGDSEVTLGDIGLKQANIISKLPSLKNVFDYKKNIPDLVNKSLSNLKLDYLYGMHIHNAEDLLSKKGEDIYNILVQLKEEGLIKKLGVSVYTPEEISLLLSRFDLDMIQAPFNPIDGRINEFNIMEKMYNSGVELHVRSVFLQGLLLMSKKTMPSKFDRWHLLWNKWYEWLNDNNISAISACLNHVLSFEKISKIIVGIESKKQLKGVLDSISDNKLRVPKELQILDKRLLNPSNWHRL